MARRVVRNGQARQEHDQGHGHDGPERIDKAVVQRQGTADGLQCQERRRPSCGVGDTEQRPLPERMGSEPQCRSEEHTSELQSLMRISYAVFCLKKNTYTTTLSHIDSCKIK